MVQLQVALFRTRQRERKSWIVRLRDSGYDIKFVNDPDRFTGEMKLVIIDTSVERWKEYIRLVQGQGIPVVLLVDRDTRFSADELIVLGAAGTVTQEEETDRVFDPFLHPNENDPADQSEQETRVEFPQYGRTLVLTARESASKEPRQADLNQEMEKESATAVVETKSEPLIQQHEALGGTLSQRKASRQSSAERSSNEGARAIQGNSDSASEQTDLQKGAFPKPRVTESLEQMEPVKPFAESRILEDENRELSDLRGDVPQRIANEDA